MSHASFESSSQFEIFPRAPDVARLDPATVIGRDTRVRALFRVRYEGLPGAHLVFHDRHGWYCAEHGADCRAVGDARASTSRRR
ncbi:MAG TPA: hypothetical protein VFG84_11300 [Gemmatimonadaceae bacterium]|nr:hypothetical protein [Gemmatimonadaceae bacterium]